MYKIKGRGGENHYRMKYAIQKKKYILRYEEKEIKSDALILLVFLHKNIFFFVSFLIIVYVHR